MKICVYFQPKQTLNNFEGARLRKNIKGALELMNIPYSKNTIDNYDIIHLISINDEFKVNDAKSSRIPTVFSAFMCETDESARLLSIKNGITVMSPKAIRVLNSVNVVFAPNESSRNLLVRNGIKTRIEIVTPGVNLARFEFTDSVEDDIFYNYYQLDKNEKYIVSVGTYEQKESLDPLIELAEKCPKYHFFFFGQTKNAFQSSSLLKGKKKIPSNLRLCPLANDEIYCSMMKHASIYLSFDNTRHAPITLLDAAASKTQIVALSPTRYNNEMLTDTHAIICESVDDLADSITGLMTGKITSHIEEGYRFAQKNSLSHLGKKLVEEYSKLLKGGSKL